MSKIDFNMTSCVTCRYDLIEDRDCNFICEKKVSNDEFGDFIENPLTFYCCYYEAKNPIEDTVVEKGLF